MKRHFNALSWSEWTWQRPFSEEDVKSLLGQLVGLTRRKSLVFEVRLKKNHVRYLLGTEEQDKRHVHQLIQSHRQIQFSKAPKREKISVARLVQIKQSHYSLKTDSLENMIRSSLALSKTIQPDEEIVLQLILGSGSPPKPQPKELPNLSARWYQVITNNIPELSENSKKLMRQKLNQSTFRCEIRLGANSRSILRTKEFFSSLLSCFRMLETHATIELKPISASKINQAQPSWSFPYSLATADLACFLLLPVGEENMDGVPNVHPKLITPPLGYNLNHNKARSFGQTIETQPRPLQISSQSAKKHLFLLGSTGTGKTTALSHLILSDIKSKKHSVVVIDAKGQLTHELLERTPAEHDEDIVVISPTAKRIVGINPFELTNYGIEPEVIADYLLELFKGLYPEHFGIYSLDILSHAFLTLARIPNSSLVMLPSLLTNKHFRNKLLKNLTDPIGLESFWSWFELLSEAQRHQMLNPILNKFRQFLLRPQLRAMLGQAKPKFSLAELFQGRKIVLVPLNKAVIGSESAKLIGSLVTSILWMLILRQSSVEPSKRQSAFIYVDETPSFLGIPNANLDEALSQSRQFNVGWAIGFQHLAQMSSNLKAGIESNTANKIVFGLNLNEAKEMAKSTLEVAKEDFYSLPPFWVYSRIEISPNTYRWVIGKTYPPTPRIRDSRTPYLNSLIRYGQNVDDLEREFQAFTYQEKPQTTESLDDLGRKKRSNRSSNRVDEEDSSSPAK
ncbi:type IV secretory system conjugative DNA transfer family protein [Streptococcus suis]|uniref:Type IV secretion system DNA-binding domain-containing protein n=1 Tax=Streptococcus suis TaxID=1307 RepID=A0A9Q5BX92_STRSU|nr:type IV secretion system DNA-binding domain-containing protein [Streptococcus suis]MCK3847422.1 type IV secretion system DNA-binding domain-containing protein [Streptococcus suis]MCK4064598.1 type IV secretion system DNA-binding domain-containing protein [Streptococcus suis]NQJ59839.1 type IV secretion system DNA-binding domain-containing protein [Streptococcus suis]NQJ64452.1 type IV secretion system DNA-binding domain-containing protein [Streptococcus suis]NQP70372.1 type IV secretion sys